MVNVKLFFMKPGMDILDERLFSLRYIPKYRELQLY